MSRVTTSYFRQHIEDHFDGFDMDVVCRKRKHNYCVYWADDGMPFARLRPTGTDDDVEVFWWNDDRWDSVAEFGLVLPVEQALEYITDDPDGLFFNADTDPDEPDEDDVPPQFAQPETAVMIRRMHLQILTCAVVASAVGGACFDLKSAFLWGFVAIVTLAGLFCLRIARWWRQLTVVFVPLVLAPIVLAAPAVIVGSGLNQALGGGILGIGSGVVVGAVCVPLLSAGGLPAWLVGFWASLLVAARLVTAFALQGHFSGLLLTAAFVCIVSASYRWVMTSYRKRIKLVLAIATEADATDDEEDC